MTEKETTYRVVVEDNGREIEPPASLVRSLGSFSGLKEQQAKNKILLLTSTFKKWVLEKKSSGPCDMEIWACEDRLVSCRRGDKTRTYSVSPEWLYREVGL